MSAFKGLGLSAPTSELKAITPYLQRAEEVLKQDPIIAYWCAYYAAQVGISAKAKDPASRHLLLELLTLLENLKKDIGSNDAMEIEAASAAYIENFGLRVFSIADNEDRQGKITRGTAKKFLAAAHFLEVLKVFGLSEVSESTREKIRYAKWKAADISKAFREGRKPIPGPAESELDALEPEPSVPLEPPLAPPPVPSPPSTNVITPPPPELSTANVIQANQEFSAPSAPPLLHYDSAEVHSETWSTAATPGTFTPHLSEGNSDVGPHTVRAPKQEATTHVRIDAPQPDLAPPKPSAPAMHRDATLTPGKPVAPPQPQQTFELTPVIIAKAQKYARFAISALDYEDVATARRELRNALALLGE